jgi:hypothetical protein
LKINVKTDTSVHIDLRQIEETYIKKTYFLKSHSDTIGQPMQTLLEKKNVDTFNKILVLIIYYSFFLPSE